MKVSCVIMVPGSPAAGPRAGPKKKPSPGAGGGGWGNGQGHSVLPWIARAREELLPPRVSDYMCMTPSLPTHSMPLTELEAEVLPST